MRLTLNGRELALEGNTLVDLLASLAIPLERKGIAIAVNDVIVQRSQWPDHVLQEGDRIDLITAVQGG